MKFLVMLLFVLSAATVAVAQPGFHSPKPDSPERKAILEAIRKPVEKELKQHVVFTSTQFNVDGDWAFFTGVPRRPDGKKIDYLRTGYKIAVENGAFDDGICALVRKRNAKWQLVTHVIGATDVPWVDWDKEYGAPSGIFRK